jgi:hypothetical protein
MPEQENLTDRKSRKILPILESRFRRFPHPNFKTTLTHPPSPFANYIATYARYRCIEKVFRRFKVLIGCLLVQTRLRKDAGFLVWRDQVSSAEA